MLHKRAYVDVIFISLVLFPFNYLVYMSALYIVSNVSTVIVIIIEIWNDFEMLIF